MQAIAAKINELNPGAVAVTGDITNDSTEAQFNAFSAFAGGINPDVYCVPGNHDEGAGLDWQGDVPGEVATFAEYDAAISARHFTVDVGNVRLIGVHSQLIRLPDTPNNSGAITVAEINWLTTQLQNLGGKIPVICSHYPITAIDNAHGGTSARNLCSQYGVRAWLGGHLHTPCLSGYSSNLFYVNGDSANFNEGLDGGMMVCDVYEYKILVSHIRARAPWELFRTVDVWTY